MSMNVYPSFNHPPTYLPTYLCRCLPLIHSLRHYVRAPDEEDEEEHIPQKEDFGLVSPMHLFR